MWCSACYIDVKDVEEEDLAATKIINSLFRLYDQREELSRKAQCRGIEIINIPADETIQQFFTSFSKVPWKTIDFKEKDRLKDLMALFRVEMVPHVAVVKMTSNELKILNPNAVNEILLDKDFTNFPYVPSPITDLNKSIDSYGYSINARPSVVLLLESSHSDSIKYHVYESLVEIAKAFCTDKISDIEVNKLLLLLLLL